MRTTAHCSILKGSLSITIGLEIGLLTKITFWSLLKIPCRSSGENRVKKFSGKVDVKCHQSCLVALVGTKLYVKLAVSLCSFSQFSFSFNFRTANAQDLKIGTLPLGCLFSNTLLAILICYFIHRFAPKKMGQN